MSRALLLLIALAAVCFGEMRPATSPFMVRVWISEDGLPGNIVRSVDQATDGLLWIATAEGVASFDGYQFHTISTDESDGGNTVNYFRVFALDDGSVWISTYDGKLFCVADHGRTLEEVELNLSPGDRSAISLMTKHGDQTYVYRASRFWILTPDGASPLESPPPALKESLETAKLEHERRGRTIDDRPPPTRLIGRNGETWTLEGGVLTYHSPDHDETEGREVGRKIAASDLLEDREGNLWIANPVDGLMRIRKRRVRNLAVNGQDYTEPLTTALLTSDGTWWAAKRDGVVDRIREGVLTRHPLTGSDRQRTTSCIFEDSNGRLWFGTRDGALKEWDETTGSFSGRFTEYPHFSKIRAIAEDSGQRLWFGGLRGLFRVSGTQVEDFSDYPVISGAPVTALTIDRSDNLYVGTADGRILTFDGSRFSSLAMPDDQPQNWISSIVPRDQDEVWVSSIGDGLHLFRNGRWHRFGEDRGIPDERITALTLVGDDGLWMGSLTGIIRASRSELLECLGRGNGPPGWLLLDRSDGMRNRECVGRCQPNVVHAPDGSLWFPTSSGLARVRPDRITLNDTPPTIRFAPVEINGIHHPVTGAPLTAGPGRIRLTFGFSGISLTEPEKLTYTVRLVGLDDDWQLLGHERRISYQVVPPGNYRFEVTAINGDGIVTSRPATVPIVIRPHIWETPWFISFAAAIAVAIILGTGALITRLRVRRRMRELQLQQMLESERTRISRDLHDELGASLTELSILSALAKEDPDDTTLRPSLDQLTIQAQRAVGDLDEIVWATNPKQDSLKSLVEYIAYSSQDLLQTVRIPFECTIQPVLSEIAIGPRRRHNVVLATREAINNTIKHAHPDSVHLKISEDDGNLVVRITDDGRGIESGSAPHSFGMKNMQQRMSESGGTCKVMSTPGSGTTVTLTLPLPR